jgi:hypothetical protein
METEIIFKRIIRKDTIAISVLVKKDNIIKGFIMPIFKITSSPSST